METKKFVYCLLLSLFSNIMYSQTNNDFLEVKIDLSDSTVLNKDYVVEGIQTVYIIIEDENQAFIPLEDENLEDYIYLQNKVLEKIRMKNIDTLLIWGTEGEFDCYRFMQNSLSNINNLFIFASGGITLENSNSECSSTNKKLKFKNIGLEGFGITLDLDVFNKCVQVKNLVITEGCIDGLKLKHKTSTIDVVYVSVLIKSKRENAMKKYRKRFLNTVYHSKFCEFTFNRNSSLNIINLRRESNWKKL